jgi:peptidoglycan/xylan/chitin deacetylase (PgdA/CDA1 family)
MMRPAGLSVDIDSVASHLEGYGFRRPPDDGVAYTVALPRILELLSRTGSRATFFLIAEEARSQSEAVRRIVAEGHEVASHSMTHRLPFVDLDPQARHLEITASKALLEDLGGQEVSGFRAPSWDAGPWLVPDLVAAGYRYDSSAYPSVLLLVLRAAVAWRGHRPRRRSGRRVWSAVLGPRKPYRIETVRGSLVEVPMYTIPVLRLPYYHTLRFVLPGTLFRFIRRVAQAQRQTVWYQFHAVDFLSMGDGLDQRIACHPGMRLSLERKLELAAEAIRDLGHERTVIPLRELVAPYLDASGAGVELAAMESA